ncbi:MAG: 4'-phosphopantetheinyl transferase superfamily protein [Cyanobacteria bacterium P01_A01_bin.37]
MVDPQHRHHDADESSRDCMDSRNETNATSHVTETHVTETQDALQTAPEHLWRSPDQFPCLKRNDIHIWRASLACSDRQQECYRSMLSQREHQRAARLQFEHLRHRFVACRGMLRALLGRYLAIAPEQIQFIYGAHGKPTLNDSRHPLPLSFNLSHSNDLALFAFCRSGALGVDVEYLRSSVDVVGLSKRFFTAQEHQAVMSRPAEQRILEFFNIWTCKEAYLKATGEGLAGLQTVEVDIQANKSVNLMILRQPLLSAMPDPSTLRWQMCQCWPQERYVGAIALGSQALAEPLQSQSLFSQALTNIQTFSYPHDLANFTKK